MTRSQFPTDILESMMEHAPSLFEALPPHLKTLIRGRKTETLLGNVLVTLLNEITNDDVNTLLSFIAEDSEAKMIARLSEDMSPEDVALAVRLAKNKQTSIKLLLEFRERAVAELIPIEELGQLQERLMLAARHADARANTGSRCGSDVARTQGKTPEPTPSPSSESPVEPAPTEGAEPSTQQVS